MMSSHEAISMTRSVSRPQLQQTIIIDSCGYDASGNTKPLELHRHVFAKGHQSTKALEFVLWFLFSRLDKIQTRDRFKECWPVLDRHDAREFRNVAFKWLEELRKVGCFGVGHQLTRDNSSASLSGNNATNNSNNTSSNAGGLGLFLPTIRRSYLDESIGERIEQLVLVLSTYVLSTVIKKEQPLPEEGDRTMWELISHVPESIQDEATLLESIDSQIVRRSQSYLRDVEHQKAVRMEWTLKSQEICGRLNTYSKEFMNVESDRRMFLIHQPHIADRTGMLSLEELQVLEDRWIEKINDQWRPILRFVEKHVERKDFLQALLDADSGSGSSVLDGERLQKDLTMTLGHLANQGSYDSPSVDLVSILKIWKHSLHQLESGINQDRSTSDASAAISQNSLEKLSRSHAQQLEAIKGTRTHASQSVRQSDIRNQIRACASELSGNQPHSQHISDVLLVRAPVVTVPKPSRSPLRAPRINPFKVPPPFIKSTNHKPITYKPTNVKPATPATPIATAMANPARSPTKPSSSINTPPASFIPTKNGLTESRALPEFPRKRSLAKESVFKPVPEDLVVREKTGVSQTYEAVRKDVLASLTDEPSLTTAPPAAVQNNKRSARPNTKPLQSTSARTISPNSKRTALWTSLFQGRDSGSKTGTTNHVSVEKTKLTGPTDCQLAQPTEIVADNATLDHVQPIHQTQEAAHPMPATPPPATPPSRSILRGRVGVSRKRRQSSDFQPGRSTTPLQPVPDEPLATLLWEKEAAQPAKADNLFQESDDEPPGTPSKRRRTDSVLGRRTSFVYDKEVTTKDDPGLQSTKPISRTPDRSTLLKALRSPKLTLDDLRAPTPKPIKTKEGESISMPLMLLHTPQQKLLFQMETGQIPKVSNPFSSLTPSSLMDPKGKSSFMSPSSSPFKRPAFSTSIFARFKSNPGRERQEDSSPMGHSIQTTPDHPSLWDTSSPFAPSPTPVKNTRTPPPLRPTAAGLTKSADRKPLTTTSILKHLLNGNSVVLDRICDKAESNRVNKTNDPPATTAATLSAQTTTTASPTATTKPTIQEPRHELKEARSIRPPASKIVKKATHPHTSTIDENAAVLSLGVKQNPWGRPPSWKPEAPKMIDIDNKHQTERARRLAAKGGFGIAASSNESLARSTMGSLKVSVFGRSMHPTAALRSSTSASASYSSLSSVSLRSLRSDSGVPSSHAGPGTTTVQGQAMSGDDVEEEDEDDDPDNDTRGFSPPVVSPIRGSDAERYKSITVSSSSSSSLSSSMMMSMMMSTRRQESEKPRFHIPSRSVPPYSESIQADEPPSKAIESTPVVAEAVDLHLDQETEAERLRFLDEPAPEFVDEIGEEDEGRRMIGHEDVTVMNYALQPIFGESEGSQRGQGQGQGGFRRSLSTSMPRIFGSSGSTNAKDADLQASGVQLSHHRHDGLVSDNGTVMVNRDAKGIEQGEGEGESMSMVGRLFDEMMPEGLDPDEALWENTELFS
ncbi:hypothetical protein BGZ95_010084 [Linnemannia exigua]|uniref:HAUS augmin-like complex subunit 6 N-terminal domain-containing protein n=1 Tax=Linnemannia exigua TaxID=604196 RepID=A0AAD4H9I2_9FUNG|nr:hypothetical protein BGZ95_010084 [Linnemannia exigua]